MIETNRPGLSTSRNRLSDYLLTTRYTQTRLQILHDFRYLLARTGRVCPKPWHWARFYHVYRPHYPSIWLMDWWQTSNDDKQDRLIEQLDFLARQTDRFTGAMDYLLKLDQGDWHCEPLE